MAVTRKRPCKICRRWFLPNARLKDHQKTCGRTKCKKEWHRIQCKQWNKRNPEYFKANYLEKKIERITHFPQSSLIGSAKITKFLPKSRIKLGLPRDKLRELINAEYVVIIEYIVEQVLRRSRQSPIQR